MICPIYWSPLKLLRYAQANPHPCLNLRPKSIGRQGYLGRRHSYLSLLLGLRYLAGFWVHAGNHLPWVSVVTSKVLLSRVFFFSFSQFSLVHFSDLAWNAVGWGGEGIRGRTSCTASSWHWDISGACLSRTTVWLGCLISENSDDQASSAKAEKERPRRC